MEAGAAAEAMRHNLRILPWWWVLRWAWFGEAIWVIYLVEDRGLTVGSVVLFEAAFFTASVLAEVPTGIVADRYGRRPSMVAGSLFTAVAFLVFGLATAVPLLLGSYVLFAIGAALMSGADDAFLFDSLRAEGRSADFASLGGRLNAAASAATAAFTVIGGLMALRFPLAWAMVLSAVPQAMGAAFAWRLIEPPVARAHAGFLHTGARSARRVVRSPGLRYAVLLAALAQGGGMIVFTVFQPVVVEAGAPVWTLGGIGAAMLLVNSAGGWSAGALARRLRLARSLVVLPLLAAFAMLGGAAGSLWVVPVFALAVFAWSALHPQVADYLSRRVPDEERATALSVNQLAAQVVTIGLLTGLGVTVDRGGLGTALLGAFVVLLALAAGGYLLWRRAGDQDLVPAGEDGDAPALAADTPPAAPRSN